MDLVQYSVVLMRGEEEFFRGYVWTDSKSIERAVEVSNLGCSCDLISGGRGFLVGGRCVAVVSDGSFGFFARNEKDANYFASNFFSLSEPFFARNGEYVFSPRGE